MVGYLGQELPISAMSLIQKLSFRRWHHVGQEAILRPRIQVALQDALVPSIADKTELAFVIIKILRVCLEPTIISK